MNIPLLRRVQKRITSAPNKFRMDVYTCGTAHCIAGWAWVIARNITRVDESRHYDVIKRNAPKVLRLDDAQADRLFHLAEWPKLFESEYGGATTTRQKARIAARRIDHFIATGGAE